MSGLTWSLSVQGEHPPWSTDQLLPDQASEELVALWCACRTQEVCKPQGPWCMLCSLSWNIRDLRLLPNSSVNSCIAAPGWVLAGFQVTATWTEEQSEILAACTLPWAEQQHLQGGAEKCLWCHGPELQQKWSAQVRGLDGRHFGPAASTPACFSLCGEWRRPFRCFEARRRASKSGHQWLKGWRKCVFLNHTVCF